MSWLVVGYPGGDLPPCVLYESPVRSRAEQQLALFRGHLEDYVAITLEEDRTMPQPAAQATTRTTLKLTEAEERTPPISAVQAMQRQLQLALFGAVTEGDILDVVAVLKDRAKQGDLKAINLLLSLVLGKQQAPAVQVPVQVNVQPPEPTDAPPGSAAKIAVMRERADRQQPTCQPGDADEVDNGGRLCPARPRQ